MGTRPQLVAGPERPPGATDAPTAASPGELADLRAALGRELDRLAGAAAVDQGAPAPSPEAGARLRTGSPSGGAATDETAFRYHSHFRNAAPPSV